MSSTEEEKQIHEYRRQMIIGGVLGLIAGLIVLEYIYYLIGVGAFDFLFK